jgi:hypothetical protein
VLGGVGDCFEILFVDACVADRLTPDTRPITDHMRQQNDLVLGHLLRLQWSGYSPRNCDPITGFQAL